MGVRKEAFVTGEIYHCYNRGVDKRDVFMTLEHFDYIIKICDLFNQVESLGGIKEYSLKKNCVNRGERIVTILSYCFNPNHFHLLLRQEVDGGVSKFMQKLSTGYTMYFNKDQNRSGSLFQGKFKSKHVGTDVYLKHLLVYVNRNNEVHGIADVDKFKSSHQLFASQMKNSICDPREASEYFDTDWYRNFGDQIILDIKQRREELKEIEFEK